jgi:SOS-response transcriptional repressor LexA
MFHIKLDKLLKKNNLTNVQLSKELLNRFDYKISKESIGKYRKGERTPSPEFIDYVLKFTNSSSSELFNNDEKPVKYVPILANASCGASQINTLQDLTMKTAISQSDWNSYLYAVVANGDSMATEIYDGDICIIDPNQQIQDGDIVFYKLDDEAAIKIYVKDEDNYLLNFIPFNSNEYFKTRAIRLDDEDMINKLTVHKVVQVVSSKKNNRSARLKMIGR